VSRYTGHPHDRIPPRGRTPRRWTLAQRISDAIGQTYRIYPWWCPDWLGVAIDRLDRPDLFAGRRRIRAWLRVVGWAVGVCALLVLGADLLVHLVAHVIASLVGA